MPAIFARITAEQITGLKIFLRDRTKVLPHNKNSMLETRPIDMNYQPFGLYFCWAPKMFLDFNSEKFTSKRVICGWEGIGCNLTEEYSGIYRCPKCNSVILW
jgi:hypothetical protein